MKRDKVTVEQVLNIISSSAEYAGVHLEVEGNADLARRMDALSEALLAVQDEFCDVLSELDETAEDLVGLECSVDPELHAQMLPEPADQDACPGCGAKPGDGYSDACNHPAGCGYYKAIEVGVEYAPKS